MTPETIELLKIFGVAIVSLVAAIVVFAKILVRKMKNNPGLKNQIQCKPGHGEMCQNHDRAITKLTTSYEFLKEAFPKLEKKVDDNFMEVFEILRSLRSPGK